MSDVLDASEAAALLGVSKRAVYSLAAPNGPIPCTRPTPRRVEFRLEDIESYKAACRSVPPVRPPPPSPLSPEHESAFDAAWRIAIRVAVDGIARKPTTTLSAADLGLSDGDAAILVLAEPPLPMPDAQSRFSLAELSAWSRAWCVRAEKRDGPTTLYRHFDEAGALLYIGIAFDVEARTRQHRREARWAHLISSVTTELYGSRLDALSAETAAIQRENPPHNIRR